MSAAHWLDMQLNEQDAAVALIEAQSIVKNRRLLDLGLKSARRRQMVAGSEYIVARLADRIERRLTPAGAQP